MAQMTQFYQLLERLLSNDDDIRKQAEEAYEAIGVGQRAELLLQTAQQIEVSIENRQMALVLLRRLLSNSWEDLWPHWTEENRNAFRQHLLALASNEKEKQIRKKLCDVLAEVARNHLDDDGNQTWPDVLKFLFECASSNDESLKELSLLIFDNVPGIFGNETKKYLSVVKDMLYQSLLFKPSKEVRSCAVRALTTFLSDNDEDHAMIKQFNDCLAPTLIVCAEFANSDEDAPLQCLVDLAGTLPKFLRPKLHDVCSLCLTLLGNKEREDTVRHAALEVLVSLAEAAPPMFRKDAAKFLPPLILQCLQLMIDLEDDDDWAKADDTEEDDDSNATIGETSLDRLACALGGKCILPCVIQAVPAMLQSQDWRERHAGLMAFSSIGEGCHKEMEVVLQQVIELVVPFLHDTHPRVRYAACNCIGQLSSDFATGLQKKYHDKIISPLISLLDDYQNPRVQAHAGAALVNFSEDCPKATLSLYLNDIMSKLEQVFTTTFKDLLENRKKLVLEQIITTIASVADTAEEAFVAYYDRVMPCLKYILQNATDAELKVLRGKTIECISLIGLAVGKDKFFKDAGEVMNCLLLSQADIEHLESDDPQLSYMISAWARMCKIMGSEFKRYLPMVMPAVMKTAAMRPEVTVVESEDTKALDDNEWEFVNLGDQQSFGIRTVGLEEKSTACQMLVCYARELKESFAEYVDPVTKLMVPLLKFYFHDGVRMAAAESLPLLLEAGKSKGFDFVRDMWAFICPELLNAIDLDPEQDAISEHMYSFAMCVTVLGSGCLTNENMQKLLELIIKKMDLYFKNQSERAEKRKDEDYDEEVENELLDEDDEDVYVLSKISDIIHALFGTHKESFLPYFETLLPVFTKLLESNRPYRDLQWGLCIFDDVIEFAGAASMNYQHLFLNPMLAALSHDVPEVRQAAAYGCGIMAMHGGIIYAQACAQSLPLLAACIQRPDARETTEVALATENAISAVAKILKYNASMINPAEIIPVWLSWLPICEDKDEIPYVFNYLCELVEANNIYVLGENHSNLPNIVRIVAEAERSLAFEEVVDLQVHQRVLNILVQLQSDAGLFARCISVLNNEQLVALRKAGIHC